MPYFYIRNGDTAVEAIGLAITTEGAYYASFAGPAEVTKAVWAAAVGSKKTGVMSATWKSHTKMLKPNARATVKLPNTNYVHCILRSADPTFILITDPIMGRIREYDGKMITPYGNKETTAPYHEITALLPDWQFPTWEGNRTYSHRIAEWYADQPQFKAILARKLVNALNQATEVPVLPEWGPALLAHLPDAAQQHTTCYGDALAAIKLNASFDWSTWIGGLLKDGIITIPDPAGE